MYSQIFKKYHSSYSKKEYLYPHLRYKIPKRFLKGSYLYGIFREYSVQMGISVTQSVQIDHSY